MRESPPGQTIAWSMRSDFYSGVALFIWGFAGNLKPDNHDGGKRSQRKEKFRRVESHFDVDEGQKTAAQHGQVFKPVLCGDGFAQFVLVRLGLKRGVERNEKQTGNQARKNQNGQRQNIRDNSIHDP